MNELMIFNEDNQEEKSYAIYYTINDRFYTIYTTKEKDENGYVILHIAKVLKEVNNTPEGIVPTGKYIGLEISDQSEWDNAKVNIGEIVSNKQNNTPTSVSYLPVSEINGISIKSSKTFKLREDVVDSIIVESQPNDADTGVQVEIPVADIPTVTEEPAVDTVSVEEPMSLDAIAPVDAAPVDVNDFPAEIPAIAPVEIPVAEEPASVEPVAPEVPNVFNSEPTVDVSAPAIAPNPFEMQPDIEIPEPVVEEEVKVNPYEVMQQQRAEEMINALATDDMQDIVAAPVIPVTELESKVEETPEVEDTPVVSEETPAVEVPVVPEPVISEETPTVEETTVEEEAVEEETPAEEPKVDVVSSESFVDSIVADVSDILDKKEEPTPEEKEDYERLYNDALEKTVELEKELAELHKKIDNIKNIVE